MADISTEALYVVRNSLSVFQTDIEGLSIRSLNCANTITNNCTTQIKQTKLEISQIEQTISELERKINSLENAIIRATDEYHNLIARIPKIQNTIQSLNSQISYLNSQIASLYAQLCDTDDDDIRQQLEDQIAALEEQIQQCECQCSELKGELRNAEERKTDLQQQISSVKSEKAEYEDQCNTQKKRCNKMKNKLERLQSAFSHVESDLNIYVAATKKFESNSLNSMQNNTNAVRKCLDSINQYLAINLGPRNSGSSLSHGFASNSSGLNNSHTGSPEQQLRDYMYSHNYGIDDYNTYSQDPEWQELHSQVYPDSYDASTIIKLCGRKWVKELSQSEHTALKDYTVTSYRNINAVLRGIESDYNPGNQQRATQIHNALSRSVISKPCILYRGASLNSLGEYANLSDSDLIGNIISDAGFMSTCLDESDITRDDIKYEISVPPGTHGAYLGYLSQISHGESEVLLDAGQRLQITSIQRETFGTMTITAMLLL